MPIHYAVWYLSRLFGPAVLSGCVLVSFAAGQTLFKLPVLNPRQKVALVVGNNDYQSVRSLRNAKNDAQLISDTLRVLGFRVIDRYDLSQSAMETAFRDFSAALDGSGVAFFFYAGHGLQVGGKNYLVPTDYDLQKGVGGLWDVGTAMNGISGKSRMNIIVLDACRNASDDIYKSLDGQPGFTEFKNTPDGTFVAFSTSPGKIASDGAGENSPYTKMLAEALRWKPAQLEQVFMYTQLRVEEETAGQQVPWRNSSTKALFFFTPDETALAPLLAAGSAGRSNSPLAPQRNLAGSLQTFGFSVPFVNERGTIIGQKKGQARRFIEKLGLAPLEMIEINGGRFLMGGSEREIADALAIVKQFDEFKDPHWRDEIYRVLTAELPRHAVNVKGFYMSRTEITQAQYLAVMGKLPKIEGPFSGPNMPVVNVTWTEANEFCARLSTATGKLYRLPTEAEWEYAARAGTDTPFAFGETVNPQLAVYNWLQPYGKAPRGARRNGPTEVGALNSTNAFGLADMHGNVFEWCADYWHSDYDGAPTDGSSWDEPQAIVSDDPDEKEAVDTTRVVRGGSWQSPGNKCRSASRFRYSPATRSASVGFRVVMQ
jgi:formylglycine-generating enzyme required for sulfatase activity